MSKYRPYPAYKDSGVEWLGQVPEHWNVLDVKYLFRLVAEPAPVNNDYELLSVYTDIGVKPRKELEQKGNKASTTDGYWRVRIDDLIVNKLLAWMGAIGHSAYDGVTSPAYDILRPFKGTHTKFYHFLFRLKQTQQEFKRWSRGIMEMRLRLYFDELGNIPVYLPPYKEQKQIADFLDQETQKIDTLIEKQQKMIDLLKEKRQAVISHAVTKGLNPNAPMKDSGIEWLGEIPEHWDAVTLKRLLIESLMYGANESADRDNPNDPRYIRITDIKSDGTLRDDTFRSLPEEIAKPYLLKNGSVLLARSGATVGKSFLYDESWGISCFAGYLIKATVDLKTVNPKFVYQFCQSSQYWQWLSSSQIQATIENVSAEKYAGMYLTLPSLDEQNQIVDYLDTQTQKIDTLIDKSQQAIELLKERKTALISAAVTGKIDVRGIDDV